MNTLPRPAASIDHLAVPGDDVTALAVRRFKALADPTRLRMLTMLAGSDEALCVCHFTEHFDLEQPTISHHLRVLREAGLVVSKREGSWVYSALHSTAREWVRATLAALPREP